MEHQHQQQQYDEQQVAQAALAMVQPSTSSEIRHQASQYLESWTRTPQAWDLYAKWLSSFRSSPSPLDATQIGIQLLCLTLLQAKIRRDLDRRENNQQYQPLKAQEPSIATVQAIRQELWDFIQSPQLDNNLLSPACLCVAAFAIRCGQLPEMISVVCPSSPSYNTPGASLPTLVSFRLLSSLSDEASACSDLTSSEVCSFLMPFVEPVLDTTRRALAEVNNIELQLAAVNALRNWVVVCRMTLTVLNTPTFGGPSALLPVLMEILSRPDPSNPSASEPVTSNSNAHIEKIWVAASQCISEAISIPADHFTDSRQAAAGLIWSAFSPPSSPIRFISLPLQIATQQGWDDAAHALATLACTFLSEHMEDVATQPAEACLQMLLHQIQGHPTSIPVVLTVMDVWLTVQEVEVSARHEHWRGPLFLSIVQGLLKRIAYPQQFTTWDDEIDVDQSEFDELRRSVTDVLVSSYFLLKEQLIDMLLAQCNTAEITTANWMMTEASLFCLSSISKEVCERCKKQSTLLASMSALPPSPPPGILAAQNIWTIVTQLATVPVSTTVQQFPKVLLSGIVTLCGSYSLAWHSLDCPPETLAQNLLPYLQSAVPHVPLEAAKSIRSISVGCLAKSVTKLVSSSSSDAEATANTIRLILRSTRESIDVVSSIDNEEAMVSVAEGTTRVMTKLVDPNTARQSLSSDLLQPILARAQQAVAAIESNTTPNATTELAIESLARHLSMLQVIVRFCDAPHLPLGDFLLSDLGPFLSQVTSKLVRYEALLPKIIAVHKQFLRTVPKETLSANGTLSSTIQFVMEAFSHTKHPCTLDYVSAAVEVFGGADANGTTDPSHMGETTTAFRDLLVHVTTSLTTHFSSAQQLSESTELIQAYFECVQRYLLYCPSALISNNPQFPTVVSMAIQCLGACQGNQRSTRATLLFLSQLFGWRMWSRASSNVLQAVIQESSVSIDAQLAQHGPTLVQACVSGLVGGGPQMLWPALSDCLYAVVFATISANAQHNSGSDPTAVIRQWLLTATGESTTSQAQQQQWHQVVGILLELAQRDSRSKAKMLLTDFAKIRKGEMAPDTLLSYSL